MTALKERPRLSRVDQDAGARIGRRRSKLGMTLKGLAEESGVDRDTLSKIEKGGPSRGSTIGMINSTLDRLEHEMGMDLPAAASDLPAEGLVEFSVSGNFGVSVIVKGPIKDIAELQAAAARLVEQMQAEQRSKNE